MSDDEPETWLESKIVRKTMEVNDEGGRKLVQEDVIFEDLDDPIDELSENIRGLSNRLLETFMDDLESALREEAVHSLLDSFGPPASEDVEGGLHHE